MDLSGRMNNFVEGMRPSEILDFNQKISGIPHLIRLTIGEPDFPTPQHIKNAAIRAIQDNRSHYTNPWGLLSLRQNAAQFLRTKYHLNYSPENQIIVTTGVSEGIHSTLSAILNPGDEVVIPTPIFPLYIPNTLINGAKVILVDDSRDGFLLTPEKLRTTLEAHPKTKAVILNYPNNPVGNTYSRRQLQALAKVIKHYHIFCVCDEIYSELTYDHSHTSIGEFLPDQAIVLNGVSKAFAMTGYRIGLVCGPAKVITKINGVHTIAVTTTTTCAQYAANEAFKNGYDDGPRMRNVYRKRRDVLRNGLAKAGFTSPEPSGAFYIFAKIPDQFTQNSLKFAYQLAREAHVGVIPGSAFGPGGEGHLRISYAVSISDIKRAIKRIQKFVDKH